MGAKILVIDDEKSVCLTCRRILTEEGHQVDYCLSGLDGVRQAVSGDYEIVLLDLKMPDLTGMEALERIKHERPELSVIIITGYATIQTSIEAIKKGAFHYVPKPFTPEELGVAVTKALEDRRVRGENAYLKRELARLKKGTPILGRSRPIEDLRRQIARVAPSTFTVTIYGESGTGKELVAQAVHEASDRAEKPFVAVDISSLTPTLVESELFGHVKGAFTGAVQTRPGYFLLANCGTLFLDEIANMTLDLQGKLLRVLESRKVRAVGSETEQKVDVRVVTATNRDLLGLVEAGKFREDLYYRLNVIPLSLPPLRERADDVPLLATHFLKEAMAVSRCPVKGFTTGAMAKLVAYGWPGNVRELKNIVERLVVTVDHELIALEDLPIEIAGRSTVRDALAPGDVPHSAQELKDVKARLRDRLYESIESRFVLEALQQSGWNVSHAADAVGMQRTNFHALMRKYGIRIRAGKEGGE